MEVINKNHVSVGNTKWKHVRLVYFSGTGGTERVSYQLAQCLKNRGLEVERVQLDIQGIETEKRRTVNPEKSPDLLVLSFAVHAFDSPEPVYEWIYGLPEGKGLPVVVISVSGGGEVWPNTACRVGCIRALERKGYDVFYERMLVMPSNWIAAAGDDLAMHLLRVLPRKAEHTASEIASGVHRRTRPQITSRLMTALFKIEKSGAKFFGRDLTVEQTCTGCGWCARSCPRGNIKMEKQRPVFDWRCIACLRCVYGCPAAALHPRRLQFIPVKGGYDLKALETRMNSIVLKPVEELATGAFSGLRDYLLKEEA